MAKVNPSLKVILTVSPVPLVATNTENNVLVASSYSKSVLRAVCGEIDARYSHVQYFPSFEIVGHVASFGQYLASDLREVSERGVAHVMSCFFATFFAPDLPGALPRPVPASAVAPASGAARDMAAKMMGVECEEIFNEVVR